MTSSHTLFPAPAALVALALTLSGVATAQECRVNRRDQTPLGERIASIAERFVDSRGLDPEKAPGLVVGVTTAQGSQVYGFGLTRVNRGRLPDGDTAFQIGSVSKALTGLLAAEQVANRSLRLEDAANRHLGGDLRLPAPGGRPITLRHLVSHRSGLPSMPTNLLDRNGDGRPDRGIPELSPAAGYSRADLARYLQTVRLEAPPGQRSIYSNVGLGLVAIMVQDHLGLNEFDTLLRQRLNMVLGLQATGTNTPAFLRRIASQSSFGYTPTRCGLTEVPFSDMGVLAGAGEVISTGNDMLKVVRLLAGLGEGPLAAAAAEATRPLGEGVPAQQIGYAIDIEDGPGGLRYSKSGSCAGYSAFITFQRDPAVGVVILANRGGFSGVNQVGQAVLDELLQPAQGDVITCPVRLIRYSFESEPAFDATFDREQITAMFAVVNEIWSQAGIEWKLTSVEDRTIPSTMLPSVSALDDNVKLREALLGIAPEAPGGRMWTVVLFRQMPNRAGGLYLPGPVQTAFYTELNARGEHHPEILAHELGHSLLGGGHDSDPGNVMTSGMPDPSQARNLTAEQIEQARLQAQTGPLGR